MPASVYRKNNLAALVSVFGWNVDLVSSRLLRGAEAPVTLICTALSAWNRSLTGS
jgi:hypothetical protein